MFSKPRQSSGELFRNVRWTEGPVIIMATLGGGGGGGVEGLLGITWFFGGTGRD